MKYTVMYYMMMILLFRNATPSDSGEYECQVSSEPKLSKSVNLLVQGGGDFNADGDFRMFIRVTIIYQCRCSGLRGAPASWPQQAATSVSNAGLTPIKIHSGEKSKYKVVQ